MTMMQKIQAKKSKKGFTLVELVIVIAILAILAAIAIPVITTTINSSKLSTMQSDCATMNMLIKDWVNTYRAGVTNVTYNNKEPGDATVDDICKENSIKYPDDNSTLYFQRTIGGTKYAMEWVPIAGHAKDGNLEVKESGTAIAAGNTIADFTDDVQG